MKKKILSACLIFTQAALFATAHAGDDKQGVSAIHAWVSPSGSHLVFAADFDGEFRIWRSAIDGGDMKRLSNVFDTGANTDHVDPSWSPDEESIAFVVAAGGTRNIWVMPAMGGQAVRLTANTGANTQPAWSPDSRRIVFVSDRAGTKDIWVMNRDGMQQTRLTTSSGQENSPSFSPAGDRVVYSESINSSAILKTVSSSGGSSAAISSSGFRDYEPAWGSQGIVFSSNRDGTGRWKLHTVAADGSGLRKLGDQAGHDPRWLPDGRILFTDEPGGSRAISSVSALNLATGARQPVIDVQGCLTPVDIRPNKQVNQLNPRSRGKLPVAILSSPTFDAVKMVNQKTITFGRTGQEASLSSCSQPNRDLNGDGIVDLLCRFHAAAADFTPTSTFGVLRFVDTMGVPYEGRDAITIVPTEDPEDLRE